MNYAQPHVDWGNPIDLRAENPLPTKRGRRPLVRRRRPREGCFFFEFMDEQVLGEGYDDRHFWNPGVFSYAMIPRCRPNSRVFFFFFSIVQSIVYDYGTLRAHSF
jgi:hypothetical protein